MNLLDFEKPSGSQAKSARLAALYEVWRKLLDAGVTSQANLVDLQKSLEEELQAAVASAQEAAGTRGTLQTKLYRSMMNLVSSELGEAAPPFPDQGDLYALVDEANRLLY